MSTSHGHSETAEERIQWGKVVAVAIGALLCFAVAIGFSTTILHTVAHGEESRLVNGRPAGLAGVPKNVPEEVGIINQRLFVQDARAAVTRDSQLALLHSYGWMDRQTKTIHIPIEKAMEKLIAQQGSGPQK